MARPQKKPSRIVCERWSGHLSDEATSNACILIRLVELFQRFYVRRGFHLWNEFHIRHDCDCSDFGGGSAIYHIVQSVFAVHTISILYASRKTVTRGLFLSSSRLLRTSVWCWRQNSVQCQLHHKIPTHTAVWQLSLPDLSHLIELPDVIPCVANTWTY